MGNKQPKPQGQESANSEGSKQAEKQAKKEKKAQEKREKKQRKGKKKQPKMDMTKITPEIHALLSLDATDGNKQGQTIFSKLVNVNMVGSGLTTKAAILSQAGTALSSSENFVITEQQIKDVVAMIHEPGSRAEKGFTFGSDEFYYTAGQPGVLRGMLKTDKTVLCTVVASKQLLLVGVYEKTKQGEADEMMEALQRYFVDQGI